MNVVIVESAAKAKTINKYLGGDYKVLASFGHVRDLPAKDGSVEPDNDFAMHWETDAKSGKIMREIADAVKGANRLILATDPDREGEAISWHILKLLDDKRVLKGVQIERVAFNAVTKQAILEALKHPRVIDQPLVEAYLARRALDYLVGFTLSPVLWRKLPGARSAGRVQSVALRLVCDREAEIEAFRTREYWTITADLATKAREDFSARLFSVAGKKLDKFDVANEAEAQRLTTAITGGTFRVEDVESKSVKRNPYAPFTTSTLQQEASRKLGFSAKQTMQVAQKLYEGVDLGGETVGLITYMRTDGVQIVPEAIREIRSLIGKNYGDRYLPHAPRDYKTKAKNAQEAHEAIRPTDVARLPDRVAKSLDRDGARLYELIWKRTVASQMASAETERTTASIGVTGHDRVAYGLRATGSVVTFDGFLKLYEEGRDDDQDEDNRRLPKLTQGDVATERAIRPEQHFTEPPPRFTEATLVKRMEELGIGRPSTYASTLSVLREREYVKFDQKRLVPEDKGRLVTAFLAGFFQRYVEYDFTADLENKLDGISAGELEWKDVLRDFWRDFTAAVDETKDLRISQVLDALNAMLGPHVFPDTGDGSDPRKCPSCADGQLGLKIGKFGAFIGCSNYPDCRFTRQFSDTGEDGKAATADGKVLGDDPDTGLPVLIKIGRFGPYVQLGEPADKDDKPKRASIPRGVSPEDLTLARALALLALPRTVGAHPETGKPITSNIGRYGPFIEHDGKYAKLETAEDVFTVGLNRAVALLADRKSANGRSAPGQSVLRELGEHPDGGKIQILAGRYGAYVKHGAVNATLPKDTTPEALTLEAAVALIARKVEAGGGKPSKPARGAKKATKPKREDEATDAKPARKTATKPAAKTTAKSTANSTDKAPAKSARGASAKSG